MNGASFGSGPGWPHALVDIDFAEDFENLLLSSGIPSKVFLATKSLAVRIDSRTEVWVYAVAPEYGNALEKAVTRANRQKMVLK